MPTVEYQCRECKHVFSRVVLRGEEKRPAPCPSCGRTSAQAAKTQAGLFNGIYNLSSLTQDTN